MSRLAALMVICAAWATAYATVAFLTGNDPDFKIAAMLATACLLCFVLLNQVEHARNCRIAAQRRDVWARRDREAGQQ